MLPGVVQHRNAAGIGAMITYRYNSVRAGRIPEEMHDATRRTVEVAVAGIANTMSVGP
jgi:hypothetical protein